MLSHVSRPPRSLIVLSPNHTDSSRLNRHLGSAEIISIFSFQNLPVESWAGCGLQVALRIYVGLDVAVL